MPSRWKQNQDKEVITQRKGKGIKILYFLHKSAQVDKKLDMIEITQQTVKTALMRKLKGNINEGIKSKGTVTQTFRG